MVGVALPTELSVTIATVIGVIRRTPAHIAQNYRWTVSHPAPPARPISAPGVAAPTATHCRAPELCPAPSALRRARARRRRRRAHSGGAYHTARTTPR